MNLKALLLTVCLIAGALASNVISYKSTSSSEVTNPLLSNGGYTQLPQTDDLDLEAENVVNHPPTNPPAPVPEPAAANRDWKISFVQFQAGMPIHGAIIALMNSWDNDDVTYLLLKALCFITIAVCTQYYFNLNLVLKWDRCCGVLPGIEIKRLDFPRTDLDVSVSRFIMGPLTWISEIFTFMPMDAYQILQSHAHFPERSLLHLIFVIQLLYCFGVYDFYRTRMRPV